jgi:hypothetical protein
MLPRARAEALLNAIRGLAGAGEVGGLAALLRGAE